MTKKPLSKQNSMQIGLTEEIGRRHNEACAKKEDQYIDPQTGFMVFTKDYHLRRGTCCQSGCRHCPWGFKK